MSEKLTYEEGLNLYKKIHMYLLGLNDVDYVKVIDNFLKNGSVDKEFFDLINEVSGTDKSVEQNSQKLLKVLRTKSLHEQEESLCENGEKMPREVFIDIVYKQLFGQKEKLENYDEINSLKDIIKNGFKENSIILELNEIEKILELLRLKNGFKRIFLIKERLDFNDIFPDVIYIDGFSELSTAELSYIKDNNMLIHLLFIYEKIQKIGEGKLQYIGNNIYLFDILDNALTYKRLNKIGEDKLQYAGENPGLLRIFIYQDVYERLNKIGKDKLQYIGNNIKLFKILKNDKTYENLEKLSVDKLQYVGNNEDLFKILDNDKAYERLKLLGEDILQYIGNVSGLFVVLLEDDLFEKIVDIDKDDLRLLLSDDEKKLDEVVLKYTPIDEENIQF